MNEHHLWYSWCSAHALEKDSIELIDNRIIKTFKLFILTGVGLLFLTFGVYLLISAYELNDPFSFIIYLFASNLVILISAALTIGFIWHLFILARQKPKIKKMDACNRKTDR